jgi:hypothetical protein
MPLLRRLDLLLSFSVVVTELSFREVPLLRTVVLNGASALSVILPWARLTSLTLLDIYPRQCVPILQKTSNLVHCELVVYFESNGQPGPDTTLPYLESLTLIEAGNGPVTDFLETFIVPALRSLKTREEILGTSPIESLTVFISKSSCKLDKVHITASRLLPPDSYRQAFPSIRKFSFDDEDSSESDALGIKDNSISE